MFGDGSSRRDYTYVGDIVSGILNSLEHEFDFEIFNLGNSKTVELSRFINVIEQATGKKADIVQKSIVKGDVTQTNADISKAREMLGYQPRTDIEQGIQNFVAWYRENVK